MGLNGSGTAERTPYGTARGQPWTAQGRPWRTSWRDDQSALALSDRGNNVDDPRGQVLPCRIFNLQTQTLFGIVATREIAITRFTANSARPDTWCPPQYHQGYFSRANMTQWTTAVRKERSSANGGRTSQIDPKAVLQVEAALQSLASFHVRHDSFCLVFVLAAACQGKLVWVIFGVESRLESAIPQQKQWGPLPRRSASWQYRI
jgi:hypothetical protein